VRFFFSSFHSTLSCIPNKELAERWTGGVLAGGLFRKRRTNEREASKRQWLGARAAQKNKKNLDQLREEEKKSRTFIH
jgi:hypothetical protein